MTALLPLYVPSLRLAGLREPQDDVSRLSCPSRSRPRKLSAPSRPPGAGSRGSLPWCLLTTSAEASSSLPRPYSCKVSFHCRNHDCNGAERGPGGDDEMRCRVGNGKVGCAGACWSAQHAQCEGGDGKTVMASLGYATRADRPCPWRSTTFWTISARSPHIGDGSLFLWRGSPERPQGRAGVRVACRSRLRFGSSPSINVIFSGDRSHLALGTIGGREVRPPHRGDVMSTLSLRLPESLHKQVRELAREGISINQFVAMAVAEKMSAPMTEEYLEERARRGTGGVRADHGQGQEPRLPTRTIRFEVILA